MLKTRMTMNFRLPMKITQKGKWYVASCPVLDVFTQGETRDKAQENLKEALFLFFESCIERGTLNQVLKNCGFESVKSPSVSRHHGRQQFIDVPIELLAAEGNKKDCHA